MFCGLSMFVSTNIDSLGSTKHTVSLGLSQQVLRGDFLQTRVFFWKIAQN